jgi:hypothetical protein
VPRKSYADPIHLEGSLVIHFRFLLQRSRGGKVTLTPFIIYLAAILERVALVGEAPPAIVEWARSEGLPLQGASVLAAAVHASADLLVTGDSRDFGRFYDRTLRGVQIVAPARALDIVLKRAGI